MINCNCFNDWDYSLLVLNKVLDSYFALWIDYYLSIRNHMTKYIYVDVIRMIVMPSCLYLIFIDTSISKHVDIFFDFGFSLEDKRGLSLGSWYVHSASCFYIDIYYIMGCYYTLCHNTYAFSLLFYKVYMKRENAGSWNSGLEKEQILGTYSAQLQKSWNFTEARFGIYIKY